MPEISVIVPYFNVEKYIEKCVNSIINQSFKDIEIILVNDGSIDKSRIICEDLSKSDERIVLIDQENMGVGISRNVGIKHARGEYVSFVDSDDYIEKDMLEFLISNLKKNNADISTCGHYDCYINDDNTIIYKNSKNRKESGLLNSEEALKESLISGKISLYLMDKLYKKSLFTNNMFPNIAIHEDVAILPKIMTKINKVFYSFEPKYYRIIRKNSILNTRFSERDLNVIAVNKQNLNLIKKDYPFAIKQAEFKLFWSYLYLIDRIVCSESNFSGINGMLSFVRKNKFNILKNSFFTLKRKLLTILLFLNFNLYKKAVKYFSRSKFLFDKKK